MNKAVEYAKIAEDFYRTQKNIINLPEYPTGREIGIFLEPKEQAHIYRKALRTLGIKDVSVTTSKYGWVTIKSPLPDWGDESVARNYEDICESREHIKDTLESIWWHLFPNIRNETPNPLEDYHRVAYNLI